MFLLLSPSTCHCRWHSPKFSVTLTSVTVIILSSFFFLPHGRMEQHCCAGIVLVSSNQTQLGSQLQLPQDSSVHSFSHCMNFIILLQPLHRVTEWFGLGGISKSSPLLGAGTLSPSTLLGCSSPCPTWLLSLALVFPHS